MEAGSSSSPPSLMDLPPGFRFHPTDEEIITHYLTAKVIDGNFSAAALGEVDLNKIEPWDLPKKAKMGEKEWYFFCQRDRKYPTGMRTNRATVSGYWKATGKDKEIYNKGGKGNNNKGSNSLVGMKKTLVFYKGRAPKGEKTNWVMHEYRLEGKFSYYNFPKAAKDEWVVCRIFHKNGATGMRRSPISTAGAGLTRMNSSSFGDFLMDCPSLPPLMEPSNNYSNNETTGEEDEEEEEIKERTTTGASSARLSDGGGQGYLSYFSTSLNDHHQQLDHKNHFLTQQQPHMSNYAYAYPGGSNPIPIDSIFYPQIHLPDDHLSYLHPQRTTTTADQDHQAILRALSLKHDSEIRQCKTEQVSYNHNQNQNQNQSMISGVSQDTGLSTTDITTATSNESNYEDFEDPSVVPLSDLDNFLWNVY